MKKKKNLEDCRNDDFMKAYDCVMDLIASKMHCKNKLEKSYYPEHYPLCQSKEDMKMYIQTRRKIYNGTGSPHLTRFHLTRFTPYTVFRKIPFYILNSSPYAFFSA